MDESRNFRYKVSEKYDCKLFVFEALFLINSSIPTLNLHSKKNKIHFEFFNLQRFRGIKPAFFEEFEFIANLKVLYLSFFQKN